MDNAPNRTDRGTFGKKHGQYGHKWYPIWRAMIGRCYNESNRSYHRYGMRGIRVCEEWRRDPTVFLQWLEKAGYKKGLQLDRKDNDGNYDPSNCRIVNRSTNCRNRRDNKRYKVKGEMLLACEVEEKYGIKAATFRARVESYGKTPDEAIVNTRKLPQHEWDIDGKMMSKKDIEIEFGVSSSAFNNRLRNGWDVARAAKTPLRRYGSVVHS